jgi:hypothetical protein
VELDAEGLSEVFSQLDKLAHAIAAVLVIAG